MKIHIKIMLLFLAVLFICSCSSTPEAPEVLLPPDQGYEKNAISLLLRSDPRLNYYENMPHSLLVCVYQMKDPNSFNQLADETDGLYELLQCSLFDPSALNSKRLTVHPGQDMDITIDRAEGAKYFGIVAGYYSIKKDSITRLFEIPVEVVEDESKKPKRFQRIAHISVEVVLGPQQIHSSHSEIIKQEVKSKDKGKD
ncbi:Type VI secretion system outer membrane lipoprotein TssJ [uncultured Desulfobacterium sp.]|uniref:Type VI secretion system outer membrane lipoprotein TssJ n=1 Tax=uncultured Desulfobacterium sp. TaxID=201089 RepID=A0A445N1X4_9BACT|nr:Type VI secretion system outer membrane lipoprotein TssJ [uncultured Desulfobacterium sp.]